MSKLRNLPSVDHLLKTEAAAQLIGEYGRPQTLEAIRETLAVIRQEHKSDAPLPTEADIIQRTEVTLINWFQPTLVSVINATGTILHTNLGRAPLSQETIAAMQAVSAGYNNLEYDIPKGKRGSRSVHAEELLVRLTGAEAATVVNNNAGAVLLTLSALANRRSVLIPRTQLIEIGGGFRIPDVMKQSGAKLIEIGTTNRVHLIDYAQAIVDYPIKLVMRAHHSNFRIIGFTTEPSLEEIVALTHEHGLTFVDDLGSGTLIDTAQFSLSPEPTIQQSVKAGADIVTFSGDKLLGGPQAGIIIGKKELVNKIKKHPLARALRPDKLTLSALAATLTHYLKDEHLEKIPIWRMIAAPSEVLKNRAATWQQALGSGEVIETKSTIGGGSMPEETLPTYALALTIKKPDRFLKLLRSNPPHIIARVENDQVIFDPRTVLPEQEKLFIQTLKTVHSSY